MGAWIGHTVAESGLWSGDFGTCPGFIVTGRPGSPGGLTRFLFHMSMESGKTYEEFAAAIRSSGMTNMNAVLYTVDTRSSNPENRDPDVKQMSADAEKEYTYLTEQLKTLCGRCKVGRRYHPWGRVGEASIAPNNAFSVSP